MAKVYGSTWWGNQWLQALTLLDHENRLPRGRLYAAKGAVLDVQFSKSHITAKVQGSFEEPYDVSMTLEPFSDETIEQIHTLVRTTPSILARLLSRELPASLGAKLNDAGISLFPKRWSDLNGTCSCSDKTFPCKHITAVMYLIANAIDQTPFLIFELRECLLLETLSVLYRGDPQSAHKIPSFVSLCEAPSSLHSRGFDQAALETIDLSLIPDLGEQVTQILTPAPLFYDKDFRHVLRVSYKHWRKITRLTDKSSTGRAHTVESNDSWLGRWADSEQWPSLTLNVDDAHRCLFGHSGSEKLFSGAAGFESAQFLDFLRDMPLSVAQRLSPNARLLESLYHFCGKLIEQGAFVPQILKTASDTVFIRWIPALFNPIVGRIFRQFCYLCPTNLVVYLSAKDEKRMGVEQQILTACGILLGNMIRGRLPATLEGLQDSPIGSLFFTQKPQSFKGFRVKETPVTIARWLSRLFVSQNAHGLYLCIEETVGGFSLQIRVSQGISAPQDLNDFLKAHTETQEHFSLLADLALLCEYIPDLEPVIDSPTADSIFFSTQEFTPLFMHVLPVLRSLGVRVMLPQALQKMAKPKLTLTLSEHLKKPKQTSFLKLQELLDFHWTVALGDVKVTASEFKKMLDVSSGIVRLRDQFVLLDESEMKSLLKQMEKLPDRLSQGDILQATLSGELFDASVETDSFAEKISEQLLTYEPVPIPSGLQAVLRPYQERGFHWLTQNIMTGFGSILADDMGLGKTLQVLATILHFKNQGALSSEKVLIIAPTSLLSNWQKEAGRFTPDLKMTIHHGNDRLIAMDGFDVLITSYGLARRDYIELQKQEWFLLVLDEAQNIKNPNAEQTKRVKSFHARHKIAMSGTPVENRLSEYWSIFDFTNKNYLGTLKNFHTHFAAPIEKDRNQTVLERFTKITRPFILRRLKSDKTIIRDLPDKIEQDRSCTLTPHQAALYQKMLDGTFQKIEESDGLQRRGLILQLLNGLKQICNHPAQYAKRQTALIAESGKMALLEEVLENVNDSLEKALIFTQYAEMGFLIQEMMSARFHQDIPFFHGSLSRGARDTIVSDFQSNLHSRFLILSLKAGGTGLNLTEANHVIHYDLWWNPAIEAQATDRAYRIGQNKNVMVHRLITSGTFEERINEMLQAKKNLANLTLSDGETWITELSNSELRDLVSLR